MIGFLRKMESICLTAPSCPFYNWTKKPKGGTIATTFIWSYTMIQMFLIRFAADKRMICITSLFQGFQTCPLS